MPKQYEPWRLSSYLRDHDAVDGKLRAGPLFVVQTEANPVHNFSESMQRKGWPVMVEVDSAGGGHHYVLVHEGVLKMARNMGVSR